MMKRNKLGVVAQSVLDLVEESPKRNCQIADTIGITRTSVSYHLRQLRDRGLVCQYGYTWYSKKDAPEGIELNPIIGNTPGIYYLSDYEGNQHEKLRAIVIDILKEIPGKKFSANQMSKILMDRVRVITNGVERRPRWLPGTSETGALLRESRKDDNRIHNTRSRRFVYVNLWWWEESWWGES